MSRDMDVPLERDSGAAFRLRADRFELITTLLGHETDSARAAFIGVHPKTLRRAARGQMGGTFMAQTFAAFRQHEQFLNKYGISLTLDELFEVIEEPADAGAL